MAVQPLGKAAFGQKLFFQRHQLAVEKIVCLPNQADEAVGGAFRRAKIGLISLIRPISLIGQRPNFSGSRVVLAPKG